VNYKQKCIRQLGYNMSLKIHLLNSHLDFLPENLSSVSDEHGECFHQDISVMESCYQGRWNALLLDATGHMPNAQLKHKSTAKKLKPNKKLK
ncbi:MAG: hypothetical protein ACEY3F_08125, partial [Wolbachia sp.]